MKLECAQTLEVPYFRKGHDALYVNEGVGFAALFDGAGNSGASRACVNFLTQRCMSKETVFDPETFYDLAQELDDQAVKAHSQTTAVLVHVSQNSEGAQLLSANLGDSSLHIVTDSQESGRSVQTDYVDEMLNERFVNTDSFLGGHRRIARNEPLPKNRFYTSHLVSDALVVMHTDGLDSYYVRSLLQDPSYSLEEFNIEWLLTTMHEQHDDISAVSFYLRNSAN